MPRNNNGIYSPPNGTFGVPGTTISSARYNAYVNDITTALNNPTPINAGGTGAATADAAAASLGLVSAKDLTGVNTVGGTANAITVTTARDYDELTNTFLLAVIPAFDNDDEVTLAVDGLAAKPVHKIIEGVDVALAPGDLAEGKVALFGYDTAADSGGGAFILVSPSAGDMVGTGDYLTTLRNPGGAWLRRNGGIYDIADYPALGALLPPLPSDVTWSSVTPPFGGGATNGMDVDTVSGRIMIAAGSSVYYSDDGDSWTTVALPLTATGTKSIAYGGGRWVVFGTGELTVSTDGGDTWSTPADELEDVILGALRYANGYFVACTFDGTPGSNTVNFARSADGLAWSVTRGPTTDLHNIVFSDAAGFVGWEFNQYILTSLGGDSWTEITPSVDPSFINTMAKNGSNVVLAGVGGAIRTTDLSYVTLTSRTSSTTDAFNSMVYNDPYFIAVGANGVCRISIDDGVTWSASTTGTGTALANLVINPNKENEMIAIGTGVMLKGVKTSASQFQVPNDDPTTGWIRAIP